MKSGLSLMVVACSLIVPFCGSIGAAHGAFPSVQRANAGTRSFIYVYARHRRFAIDCGSGECDAMWVSLDEGRWALHLNPRTWVTGSESVRAAHYEYHARRTNRTLWKVGSLGSIRLRSRGHWQVFMRGEFASIAQTSGRNGVAAALMWLAQPA